MIDSNIPVLRFSNFSENWRTLKLSQVAEINRGKSKHRPRDASFLYGGRYPFVQTGDIRNADLYLNTYSQTYSEEGLKQSKLWDEGTLCITIAANIAETAILKIKACFPDSIIGLIPHKDLADTLFIKYQFDKFKLDIQRASEGIAQANLNQEKLSNIEFTFPLLPEQQKIASFLAAIDAKIELLNKKKALLEQYKKGVMQQLFSQQIRFKDENGNDFPDWEEKQFEEVFERITRKNKENNTNVLTISAQYGLISQIEFFNKSVAAQDLTGYYLLERGDFAYNKSYSNGYPMGAIKRLTAYPKGVVSTLYICFRINEGYSAGFYDQYFNSGFINHEIHKIAQEGARNHGLLNVSVIEFFRDITLACPSKKEQDKISRFLHGIDRKANTVDMQLDLAKAYKKGLLQQLFC